VHASLSNGDLGKMYDSLEALSAHPDVRKFTDWVRDKPNGRVRSRRSSTRDGA
jgi:hypothetical protein